MAQEDGGVLLLRQIDGRQQLAQAIERPSVYLDHCGLRKVSEDPAQARRLTELLQARTGTLVISEENLFEFTGLTDVRQGELADDLMRKLNPRLYLMDVRIMDVRAREKALTESGEPPLGALPCESQRLIEMFGSLLRGNEMLWPEQGFFRNAASVTDEVRTALAETRRQNAQYFEQMTTRTEREAADERALRRRHLRMLRQPGARLPSQSNMLASRLITEYMRLKGPRDPNDATDIAHACVPAVYCDAVVLDSKWADLLNRARRRLADEGVRINIARAFPASPRGLLGLMTYLERDYRHPVAVPPGIVVEMLSLP
jgi:hypothetical protein